MRLLEIEQQYTLYVDMDGVLTDFMKGTADLLGAPLNNENKKEFWKSQKTMPSDELVQWWADLDWMPNGQQLWNYVSKYNPIVLSSPGSVQRQYVEEGKAKWIATHLSPAPKKFIFEREKEKYATSTSVIIDDRSKVIDPWVAAGGIGILHKDGQLQNTIAQLRELF